jgi:GNAT superfamily N-acetyltransferase
VSEGVVLRQAHATDVPAMHRVRLAVRENPLVSAIVTEEDYLPYLERYGRGWVVEEHGQIRGFAIGDRRDGNIWALFVAPGHEGKGYGRRLHDAMVEWLAAEGCARLKLGTAAGTRAERFYERAGWRRAGLTPSGEIRFERDATPLPGRAVD